MAWINTHGPVDTEAVRKFLKGDRSQAYALCRKLRLAGKLTSEKKVFYRREFGQKLRVQTNVWEAV